MLLERARSRTRRRRSGPRRSPPSHRRWRPGGEVARRRARSGIAGCRRSPTKPQCDARSEEQHRLSRGRGAIWPPLRPCATDITNCRENVPELTDDLAARARPALSQKKIDSFTRPVDQHARSSPHLRWSRVARPSRTRSALRRVPNGRPADFEYEGPQPERFNEFWTCSAASRSHWGSATLSAPNITPGSPDGTGLDGRRDPAGDPRRHPARRQQADLVHAVHASTSTCRMVT